MCVWVCVWVCLHYSIYIYCDNLLNIYYKRMCNYRMRDILITHLSVRLKCMFR